MNILIQLMILGLIFVLIKIFESQQQIKEQKEINKAITRDILTNDEYKVKGRFE